MGRNILLVEPGYQNKYPPLGLMKIAAYHRERGDQIHREPGSIGNHTRFRWESHCVRLEPDTRSTGTSCAAVRLYCASVRPPRVRVACRRAIIVR